MHIWCFELSLKFVTVTSAPIQQQLHDLLLQLQKHIIPFYIHLDFFFPGPDGLPLPTTPAQKGMCWTTKQKPSKKQGQKHIATNGTPLTLDPLDEEPRINSNGRTCTSDTLYSRAKQKKAKTVMKPKQQNTHHPTW